MSGTHASDLEDVVAGPLRVVVVADPIAAGLNREFRGGVEDDHDVPDLVGSEVNVDEERVAGLFLARRDAETVARREPVAMRTRGARDGDPDLGEGGLGEPGAVPRVRAVGAENVRDAGDDASAVGGRVVQDVVDLPVGVVVGEDRPPNPFKAGGNS